MTTFVEGVSGGAFGGYTQSNVAARRVVPSEAGGGMGDWSMGLSIKYTLW